VFDLVWKSYPRSIESWTIDQIFHKSFDWIWIETTIPIQLKVWLFSTEIIFYAIMIHFHCIFFFFWSFFYALTCQIIVYIYPSWLCYEWWDSNDQKGGYCFFDSTSNKHWHITSNQIRLPSNKKKKKRKKKQAKLV